MLRKLKHHLADLKHGDHLCRIYETETEQMCAVVPFIDQGLTRNDRCLYVADEDSRDRILEVLATSGIDMARETERGSIRLLTKGETYLRHGAFEPQAMVNYLHESETHALQAGYQGLRFAAEMTWAIGTEPGGDRLIKYQALLNGYLPASRSVILSQYNRPRFEPACIHDVLRSHPLVVLGEEVCPNPYYEPPDLILQRDSRLTADFKARRVNWWMSQLRRALSDEGERERMLQRLQALSRQLIEVQEAERSHFARELHDEIGQGLTALRLLLTPDAEPSATIMRALHAEARQIVDDLLKTVRSLSFELRPAVLDQLGLTPALLTLFESFTARTGVRVVFRNHGLQGRLAPELETTAFRIVQEALTNVARHAGVSEATVHVWSRHESLFFQVEDHGVGFDPGLLLTLPHFPGLAVMRERVMVLGGELTIESAPGRGTEITGELPFHPFEVTKNAEVRE